MQEGDDASTRLRRNTSNHEIDLCTLYGRNAEQTDALRLKSDDQKGRLKSQLIDGEEYPPYLNEKGRVKPEFKVLDQPLGDSKIDAKRKAKLFACGGDRVNSVPQTAMMNTLLLREHNRLAGEISGANPHWTTTGCSRQRAIR